MTTRTDLDRLLIGASPPMQQLKKMIQRVGPTPVPVLIIGPRGSGKELVARALHAVSGRPGPLIAFNVCAIADTMFEDALFGHTRGAFTGATADTPGYLGEAHQGTIFFDEISGVHPAIQRKLLRVLETRTFRPVGGRADRASDFRLLSATNDDLDAMVLDGRFRADLADRLSGFVIRVPPLEHRLDDIPALVAHFLRELHPGGERTFSADAVRSLADASWSGNVRQLKHVLERALLLSEAPVVTREIVYLAQHRRTPSEEHESRTEFQRRRLTTLMDSVEWDVDAAAAQLGVHPTTVYRRLWKLGLLSRSERRGNAVDA